MREGTRKGGRSEGRSESEGNHHILFEEIGRPKKGVSLTAEEDGLVRRRVVATILVAVLGMAALRVTTPAPYPTIANESIPLETAATLNNVVGPDLDSLGGYFIENRGQVADEIRYYSRMNPSVGFRDDGVMFVFSEAGRESRNAAGDRQGLLRFADLTPWWRSEARSYAYIVRFEGSNKVTPFGMNELPFKSNFFIGNDPAGWRTGVSNFREVVYKNLYDGIDLTYSPASDGVKYEFTVSPGVDPEVVEMRYDGVESVHLDEAGALMATAFGGIRDSIPYSYEGAGKEVKCVFVSRSEMSLGFECEGRSSSETLVIDPLVYSTFIGGSYSDQALSVSVDSAGNAYVSGYTISPDFPYTPGAYSELYGGNVDAFITKLNAAGNARVYSTFLGGGDEERGLAIKVDFVGNAYVTGETFSPDFPVTPGAYSTTLQGSTDAFVTKLGAAGDALAYSTYFGSTGSDFGVGVAVDPSGFAYITGETNKSDFPVTAGAFDTTANGGTDAFVTKLNIAGSGLAYSTFLGGSSLLADHGASIVVDALGNAYVTGWTSSTNFPVTPGAFSTSYGEGRFDAFLTKLNAMGSGLLFSTFLGGSGEDGSASISIDSDSNAYVAGWTFSGNFPATPGAFDDTFNGGADAFISKLSADGKSLLYSTFLGGTTNEWAYSVAVDRADNVYSTGGTASADFPYTVNAFDWTQNGGEDVFVTKLNVTKNSLLYSTFLGGNKSDTGYSIAVDSASNVYVTGETMSPKFPTTPGAYDTTCAECDDAFVTKIALAMPDLSVTPADIDLDPPGPVAVGTPVTINATVHNLGDGSASSIAVGFYDGPPSVPTQIDGAQFIPSLPPLGGTDMASVVWNAALPVGFHDICVLADPNHALSEIDEDNNQACKSIEVFLPPIPDLVVTPSNITLSLPPYWEGSSIKIDATIRNLGGAASKTTNVSFHEGIPPSPKIGPDRPLPPVSPSGSQNVSMTWTASPWGGHELCVVVDPDDIVVEIDETNNIACVVIFVQPRPVVLPDYLLVQPLPPTATVGLSSPLPLSIRASNQGNDTAAADATLAFLNETSSLIATITIQPLAPSETSPPLNATWISPAIPGTYHVSAIIDYHGNVTEWDEMNNVYMWTIEVVSGPITSLVLGNPNYTATVTFVTSATPLSLAVIDQGGSGVKHTKYRVDNDTWIEYSTAFFLSGEGDRYVEYYSEDNAGNIEEVSWRVLIVDDTPPVTSMSTGEPQYTTGGIYVKSYTPLALSAADGGVGSNSTFYRLWESSWSRWQEYSSSFSLAGRDGTWYVEYLSFDRLGNAENVRNVTAVLDDASPVTAILPASGPYYLDTEFALTSSDSGCGVNVTMYRIDGGYWTAYSGGFTLPEGTHNISYYSSDMLNNTEIERWLVVTVEGTMTPPDVAANHKPIVALIFAVILLVAGAWSSKRRPWKGGKDGVAVAKAFMFTSLPFVVAEAGTGIISALTGQLSIPPLVGAGTLVNAAILVAGLAYALVRSPRRKPATERTRTDNKDAV